MIFYIQHPRIYILIISLLNRHVRRKGAAGSGRTPPKERASSGAERRGRENQGTAEPASGGPEGAQCAQGQGTGHAR